jgi:hypothetical protein
MNLAQRWCDLSVAEYVEIERGVYVVSFIVQTAVIAGATALLMRWRARRAARSAELPVAALPMFEATPACCIGQQWGDRLVGTRWACPSCGRWWEKTGPSRADRIADPS